MGRSLQLHDELIARAVRDFNGTVPKGRGEGDSAFCVFPSAGLACQAAHAIQVGVAGLGLVAGQKVEIRAAIHVGEAVERDQDLYGLNVNRCARIRSSAHGGQILLSEAATKSCQGSLKEPFGFRDLGSARLKDLLEPERLFQLVHPDLKADFPLPLTLDRLPNNLPHQIKSFLGRAQDLAEVRGLLSERRQVTLIGAGGSGKTRLAIQAAAESDGEFPEGIWFVDLAPLGSAAEVLPAFERSLKMEAKSNGLQAITETLSQMRCLLVVDNCEHVLDACREICRGILDRAPGVSLLATSRHSLGFDGEQLFRVNGLTLPPLESSDPKVVALSEAVSLLVERARLKTFDFAVTQANAECLNRIVHRMDGLPLAIELAASRLHLMSPEELYLRLTDFVKGLGKGPVDAVARHRTIEAAIDWSFELLSDAERSLFLSLTLLPGGWTLGMAEAISESLRLEEDPIALVSSLVDKSMAVAGVTRETMRMRMLVPVREYGLRRLGEGLNPSRKAVLDWGVTTAIRDFDGDQKGALLGQEDFGNMAAALDMAILARDFSAAIPLIRRLFRTWMALGLLADGRRAVEAVLRFEDTKDPHGCGTVHNYRGMLAWAQKDLSEADLSLRRASESWIETGDKRHISLARCNLGLVLASQERWLDAQTEIGAAHEIFLELGDETNAARSATNLGNLLKEQGKIGEAKPYLELSLQIASRQSDNLAAQTANGILAQIAVAEHDLPSAKSYISEALKTALVLQDSVGAAQALVTAAQISLAEDRLDAATQSLSAAKAAFDSATFVLTPQAAMNVRDVEQKIRAQMTPEAFQTQSTIGALKGAIQMAVEATAS